MNLQTLQQCYQNRPLFSILVVVLILSVALVFVDLVLAPETTADQRALAMQHLVDNKLPTPPAAFTHDGCTLWPDQFAGHDLSNACLTHDVAYWAGGSAAARKAADLELRETISHTGPLGPAIGFVMYNGVRLFGDSFVTRLVGANWGYGYNS